jgi:hypothetical protein
MGENVNMGLVERSKCPKLPKKKRFKMLQKRDLQIYKKQKIPPR